MSDPLRFEYDLTAADVAAGVDALVVPDARFMAIRPWLLRAVWVLLAVAGILIVYLEASFWIRLTRMGAPFYVVPPWSRAAVIGLPLLWAALLLVIARLSRDPDGALRWLRARTTRRLLAGRAPGPRALTVSDAGLEIAAGDATLFRAWAAIRRARLTGRHLALDARDLWFIVPLHALTEEERRALLLAAGAKTCIMDAPPAP